MQLDIPGPPVPFKPLGTVSCKLLCNRLKYHFVERPKYTGEGEPCIGNPSKVSTFIRADGLCFYNSVSYILTGTQDYPDDLKNLVDVYIKNNWSSIPMMPCKRNGDKMSGWEYLNERMRMGFQSKWATEVHIYAMAQVLHKDIIVHGEFGYQVFACRDQNTPRQRDGLFIKHLVDHYKVILGVGKCSVP